MTTKNQAAAPASPEIQTISRPTLAAHALVGQSVLVPDPDPRLADAWEHSFVGTLKAVRPGPAARDLATVVDQDGAAWDVEAARLRLEEA